METENNTIISSEISGTRGKGSTTRFPTRIHLSVADSGKNDLRYIQEALDQRWISTAGPNINQLEEAFSAYLNQDCVALSCGTAGIHMGLKALNVQQGDEVVCPSLTFVGSCNPILYEGARPVFLDVDPDTWTLDVSLLEKYLKQRADRGKRLPAAVLPVHLFGQSADMDSIVELCSRYSVPILEDAANALGACYRGKQVGSFGDIGVFSFSGNKMVTGSTGGLVTSNNSASVKIIRKWSNQSREQSLDYVHHEVGYNYRMSNIVAGIVRGQFEELEQRVQRRRSIAIRYRDQFNERLEGLDLMPEADYGRHTYWLSCFTIDEAKFGGNRNELIQYLDASNIDSRPVWKPMHSQPLFKGYESIGGAVSDRLNQTGICLPSSNCLTEEEQEFVIDHVVKFHQTNKTQTSINK